MPLVASNVAECSGHKHLSGTLNRMKDVFNEAMSKAPVVLLVDELDGMPQVIRAILRDAQGSAETDALQKLAKMLATNLDVNVWVSVLTGLGFATLERSVSSFVATLEQHGVQRGQWSLASMFADPSINTPKLAQFEQWQKYAMLYWHFALCLSRISGPDVLICYPREPRCLFAAISRRPTSSYPALSPSPAALLSLLISSPGSTGLEMWTFMRPRPF